MPLYNLIPLLTLLLNLTSVLWMLWFQNSNRLTYFRLKKTYFGSMIGIIIVTLFATSDPRAIFGFACLFLSLVVSKAEVREGLKKEVALLGLVSSLSAFSVLIAGACFEQAGLPVDMMLTVTAFSVALVTGFVAIITSSVARRS